MKVKNNDLNIVTSTWSEINQCFTNADDNLKLDQFFLYYWLSYKGKSITKKSLFKSFRKTVKKNNAKDYLASIKRHVEIFRFIHEPDFVPDCFKDYTPNTADHRELTESLKGIKIFKSSMQFPLLLALFDKYADKTIKWSHVNSFVKNIEAFHFVYTAITGQRSKTGVSELYSDTAFKIRNLKSSQDLTPILKTFKSGLKEFYPTKEQYLYDFKELEYGTSKTKRKHLIKYILNKYLNESVFIKAHIDTTSLTFEHFLSQATNTPYCLKIGNLLLVDVDTNSKKLKDKSTKKKFEILSKESSPWLDDPLITEENASSWNKDKIDLRTKAIADDLYDKILKF